MIITTYLPHKMMKNKPQVKRFVHNELFFFNLKAHVSELSTISRKTALPTISFVCTKTKQDNTKILILICFFNTIVGVLVPECILQT